MAFSSEESNKPASPKLPGRELLEYGVELGCSHWVESERSLQSEELGGSEMVDGVRNDGLQRYFPIISKHARCSPFARRPRSTSAR